MDEILRLFSPNMRQAIQQKIGDRWNLLQEIRVRLMQPVELIFNNTTEWIGQLRPDQNDSVFLVNQLSEFSLYRMENELREGFITIEGGHRVGLAGKVNTDKGNVKSIHHITFFNIRIAKAEPGVALPLLPYVYKQKYVNTLIIGPPQSGKTTIIRDLTRLISTGWKGAKPKKVGVIDERSEIAASIKGIPQHDLGPRADVLDACPKAEGMMMMIRSMSPDVLVVDEIGSRKDAEALMEAINAGVTVICSIHGQSLLEIKQRPSIRLLLDSHIFERMIFLERDPLPGRIRLIYDQEENNILSESRGAANETSRGASIHRYHHMDRI